MAIHYSVRREDPRRHYLAVRLDLDHGKGGPLELVLPSWAPGSYQIQESAQWIVDLSAGTGAPPTAVPVERIEKARWRLDAPVGPLAVQFRVYGHGLVNDGLDVTDEHLFLNAIRCFPYVEGRQNEPYEVSIEVPGDWTVVTELAGTEHGAHRYRARDYDELVDSPIDCGTPRILRFTASGIPHRLSVCGAGGNLPLHRYLPDLERAVAGTIQYFGESPVPSYTFFLHLHEVTDGALEHANSNSAIAPRLAFAPLTSYHYWVFVAAHEYFHLYLAKRIRPKAFDPFDYTREAYTRWLWLLEGTTDYASLLILRRAGVLSAQKYLERLAEVARSVVDLPGRQHQSLEEASLLTWIDFYHPNEETPNRSISYYSKGHLVSWMLDFELRERSENRASLQEVLRYLWREHGRPGRGLPEGELVPIVERATGVDVREFARRHISGTEELDLDRVARLAGLSFEPVPKKREPDDDEEAGDLGAVTRLVDGALRIASVRDGGPAQDGGLSPGDEIVAVDGVKVVPREFAEFRQRFPAGTESTITVFRRGFLVHRTLVWGSPRPEKYRFQPLTEASPAARTLYEAWLGTAWSPPKKPDDTS